jgi:hypothetical protein
MTVLPHEQKPARLSSVRIERQTKAASQRQAKTHTALLDGAAAVCSSSECLSCYS